MVKAGQQEAQQEAPEEPKASRRRLSSSWRPKGPSRRLSRSWRLEEPSSEEANQPHVTYRLVQF
jgi:hypothetical protein